MKATRPAPCIQWTNVELARKAKSGRGFPLASKDMAGVLLPGAAYELITRLKGKHGASLRNSIPIAQGGIAGDEPLKAIEAGVDIIDTASLAPLRGNEPAPTESFVCPRNRPDPGMDVGDANGLRRKCEGRSGQYHLGNGLLLRIKRPLHKPRHSEISDSRRDAFESAEPAEKPGLPLCARRRVLREVPKM